MVDRTAEIATLRQKLAALAAAEADMTTCSSGRGAGITRPRRTRTPRSSCSTSWKADKAKNTPTLDGLRERMAALLRDQL
jgi:hypothetical protein